MTIIEELEQYLHIISKHLTDPRVMSWPLVSNHRGVLAIVGCYLLFVLYLGPMWMKHRKPFDLRRVMVIYNIALIFVNFYIFVKLAKYRWFSGSDLGCLPITKTDDPDAFKVVEIVWWFYMTKYIELCDTVFFVLRKKENQLSKLHLIHHTGVPIVLWINLLTEPGGYNTFFALANSFVHCVMYMYYTLAAFGEDMKQHLWFKKYVTITQLTQFLAVLTYFSTRAFFTCNISLISIYMNSFIAGFFFVLFCNFYYHAYIKTEQPDYTTLSADKHHTNGNSVPLKKGL